ncbi:hypothetical protein RB595_010399 [Gaeumannomyces hyphopodioides]
MTMGPLNNWHLGVHPHRAPYRAQPLDPVGCTLVAKEAKYPPPQQYPPQAYGTPPPPGAYASPPPPQGYPPPQQPMGYYPPQQAPPPPAEEPKKDRGCLYGCLATACCCWLCGESCMCCIDCCFDVLCCCCDD